MAVDRGGTAYVVSNPDGHLWQVSTADASCKVTSFVPGQDGFVNFGMGFSADMTDPGETRPTSATGMCRLAAYSVRNWCWRVASTRSGLAAGDWTTGDRAVAARVV